MDEAELEQLARTTYLAGRDAESTQAWGRAFQGHLDAQRYADAVRCAFWLGFGLLQRGATAEGSGWLTRARAIADDHGLDGAERGYLLVGDGLTHLGRAEFDLALGRFRDAAATATRCADADLSAMSRLGCGQAQIGAGEGAAGFGVLDEVMVSVTGGELSPVVSGLVYCAVIDQCQRAFDVRRAHEWTVALSRWCDAQDGLVPYRGQCLVHRSQVLARHGDWEQALIEVHEARRRLSQPPHPALGLACYQLAELHRVRGELAEACTAYEQGHELGQSPHPGLALVRLAQGATSAAVAAIDGAIGAAPDPVTRAQCLVAGVSIMLSGGQLDRAARAAKELGRIAVSIPTPALAASAAFAAGLVLEAQGSARLALQPLRTAWSTWRELEMPYEAARTQVMLARALRAIGDAESASWEAAAARACFERIGADPDVRLVDAELGALESHQVASKMTEREQQLLRRVAQGRTNREIAEELFISVKTVERHLSNIFGKLGAANRAQATAIAARDHLLE